MTNARLIRRIAYLMPEVTERTIRNWMDGGRIRKPEHIHAFDKALKQAIIDIEEVVLLPDDERNIQ